MKKTLVSIEGNVGLVEAYIKDFTWNGFAIPYFTKENALEVLSSIQNNNEDYFTEDFYERFNEEYDCVEVVMRDNPEDSYCLDTEIIDGVKYYNVGSGWTWMEDFIDEAQIKCDVDIALDQHLDSLFVSLHEKFNTKSGDIAPDQAERLIELKEQLSALLSEQIIQNL